MKTVLTALVGLAILASLVVSASAQTAQRPEQTTSIPNTSELAEALRAGGHVILVRHGATFSNQADTDPFNLADVTKQRKLNDKGKELAKAFGAAIRAAGVPIGEVYTSQFNRAYETAVLAGFKDIETTADLSEGGLVVSAGREQPAGQGAARHAGQDPRQGQEQHPHHAQAEHRRCSRQGLVRRQGRRGIHLQAGRRASTA